MAVMEAEIEAPASVRHTDVVVSDGVRIHVMEAGEGVPVVLLHGYTSCNDAGWFANGFAKELARTHRVIGIDARGHGRSEKPHDPAKYDGDRMPADVIEVLDRLGVGKAHFHGYSMGGGIVAHLLARHPDRFITAGFGGSGVPETDEALKAEAAALDPQGLDPDQKAGQAALLARADRDNEALKAVQDGRLAKPSTAPKLDLGALDFPIQAVNGELDTPVSKTQRLAREATNFSAVVVPGRSHNTMTTWPFTPKLYLDSVAGFIRANDPK